MEISDLKKWFEEHQEEITRDFFHFLEYPTIATDATYDADCLACANWLKEYLEDIGLEVTLWETPSQPIVFAEHCKAGKKRPTLLLYHHYDVQPVDPLELWETPPFEPTVRNGKVYARGAQDNKGQCFYSITAIKALFSLAKTFNFNLKVFIEGEEESGSEGTKKGIEEHAEKLKSDYLLVIDAGIPDAKTPAITLGNRGIITSEIKIRIANGDLHSGMFGGIALNPNRILARVLSSLWDDEGKIAIPTFYDDVKEYSEEELAKLDLEIDGEDLKKKFDLKVFAPEPGFTIGQSSSIRPTVEINGMSGGYAGEGFKTVLPSVANAKISCRLVKNQDPQRIMQILKKHLLSQVPKGVDVEIICDQWAPAFFCSPDADIAKLAKISYEEVMNKPCQNLVSGGSIPIVTMLAEASEAETILMGFGLDTDQMHAPNEHFGLDRFALGFLTMGRIFSKLNEQS